MLAIGLIITLITEMIFHLPRSMGSIHVPLEHHFVLELLVAHLTNLLLQSNSLVLRNVALSILQMSLEALGKCATPRTISMAPFIMPGFYMMPHFVFGSTHITIWTLFLQSCFSMIPIHMSLHIKNHLTTNLTLFFLFFSPLIVGSGNMLCQISFPLSTKWTHFLFSSFLSTPFTHAAWLPIRNTLFSFVTYTSVAIVHFLHVINFLLMCTELFLAP